jgi:hypothetical protein
MPNEYGPFTKFNKQEVIGVLKSLAASAAQGKTLVMTSLKFLFKQAAIFSAILLILMGISSPLRVAEGAPDPVGFDILGMKLGMSVAQIEAAIKAYDPSLRTMVQKQPLTGVNDGLADIPVVGKFARSSIQTVGGATGLSVTFIPTEPSKAYSIHRYTGFPAGQQPFMDKTVQQFREKYGPESRSFYFEGVPSKALYLYWLFDRAGKQIDGPAGFGSNPNDLIRLGRVFDQAGKRIDDPNRGVKCAAQFYYIPPDNGIKKFSPMCGIELLIQLDPASTDTHLLSNLTEQLTGYLIAVDDIQKIAAEAKAAHEQQRQQQEQKASDVKVKP